MKNQYFIIMAVFCLCFQAVAVAGNEPLGPLVESTIKRFQDEVPIQITGRYLSQNENRDISGERNDGRNEKVDNDTTQTDTPEKEKNAPKKTEPLKPFVPSEKIPADQGVDFPYDI